MGKRVLAAVDIHSVSDASILYGIELAARTDSSLALIAVSSATSLEKSTISETPGQDTWMDRAVSESQQRGVSLEIFVTSGRFFEEVIRFVRSQPAVQFIVMAGPKDRKSKDNSKFASALKRLHEEFEGEILLVEKAGQITRVRDLYLQSSAREISV